MPLNVTLGVPSSPSLHLHVGEDHDGSIDRRGVMVGLRRVRLVREPLMHGARLKQGERIENWPYCRVRRAGRQAGRQAWWVNSGTAREGRNVPLSLSLSLSVWHRVVPEARAVPDFL